MIHCHDDHQVVILDQNLLLSHTYASTKDWRNTTAVDSRHNLTWRKDLFHVERPFRMTTTTTTGEPTKKKKKKNPT
ncbi:unnamed protein product [Rotaria magnacalcarata]